MPKQIVLDCERMKYPNTGLYHYCLQLAQALRRNVDESKEQVRLYVREATMPDFGSGFSFIPQHSLHKFWLPVKKEYSVWHATYQATQYFPFRKKLPVVLTVHDLNFLYDESKNTEKRDKYLRQHAKKIKYADHVVAISDYVLQDIKKHFDVEKKPCSVIYNGCNISPAVEPAMDSTKIPVAPFLYTIGTIVDKKNFHVLPPLLEKNNMLLVISGIVQSEAYKNRIIETARQYGVQNRLVFTGAIPEAEKYWYMKNCRAFLFPSVAEGFGLPVIEAMYFGLPVILSTHTSLPEIGGPAAYYFPDFEPANMQQVLEESLAHYDSMNPAEKIKQRAKVFNWNDAAKKYLDVYRSLY
ncbi:MAG: glycosyltransferase family 1 protein [Ferruginibacter sp.]